MEATYIYTDVSNNNQLLSKAIVVAGKQKILIFFSLWHLFTNWNGGVIRTLLKIYDGVFLQKHLMALRFTLMAFAKKLHHRCVRRSLMHLWRAGTQLAEDGEREEVTFFENWKSALILKKVHWFGSSTLFLFISSNSYPSPQSSIYFLLSSLTK